MIPLWKSPIKLPVELPVEHWAYVKHGASDPLILAIVGDFHMGLASNAV